MTVQVTLEVHEINTVLEGLARVQDNAARIQQAIRIQVSEQLHAAAEAQAQPEATADPGPTT